MNSKYFFSKNMTSESKHRYIFTTLSEDAMLHQNYKQDFKE